jgi:NAD(P)-dependent dehydrogenase (short-subunit alcohol dehydrogenase family)
MVLNKASLFSGVDDMKIDLSGKTAVVSASTAGIGLAIATGLAATGAETVLNGRTQEAVDRAMAKIRDTVPNAKLRGVPGDLASRAGIDAFVKAVPTADILVNNLGVFGPGDLFSTEDEEWEKYFQVNVMSGVRLTRAYLRGMMDRKWGRVVFISSESGLNIPADMLPYASSKTAQLSLARGIAKFAAGSGVTVNSVLPGPTLSDGAREMLAETAKSEGKTVEQKLNEFVLATRGSSIIRRAASTEEVANMVVYACSTQASATTGAALRVDGGIVDTIA